MVAPYLLENFDAELIDSYLGYLRPDNVLVTVAGPEIEGDQTEKWFNVAYSLTTGIERTDAAATALKLPTPNPFLPEDLTLIEAGNNVPQPMANTGPMAFYLASDTEFGVPRAMLHVSLRRPNGLISVSDVVRARLYRNLVEDDPQCLVLPRPSGRRKLRHLDPRPRLPNQPRRLPGQTKRTLTSGLRQTDEPFDHTPIGLMF